MATTADWLRNVNAAGGNPMKMLLRCLLGRATGCGNDMNIEKYTERSRGFIQSAQSLAMREGHQQFSPLHLLKVLLDDSEGLAGGLIDRAGGNSRAILKATEDALNKLPKVSGGGAGQVYLAPELARAFDAAEKAGEKAGDSFVTVERLLLGLALEKN